ncbi:SDR family oxidoreductase [Paraburkholderia hospita]|nr:SDR family oxidoreductase [Paraburkholderia hospita]
MPAQRPKHQSARAAKKHHPRLQIVFLSHPQRSSHLSPSAPAPIVQSPRREQISDLRSLKPNTELEHIMKLANKIALVTGGTSGIGLEAAKLFRNEGAKVIIIGSNAQRLKEAEQALGEGITALRADLRDPSQIDRAIAEVVETHGRIDVVYANAGAGKAAPLEAVTREQIDEQFGLNFNGLFFTIQKAAPYLSNGASIVVTTSFLNAVGTPGLSILSATKAAVRSLVRSLGAELAPRGIRINAVSPGPIDTPFATKLGIPDADLQKTGEALTAAVPLKRFGTVAEVAKAALFLASDDSSFVTGTEVVVDGGLSQI